MLQEKKAKINIPVGFHARPAAEFIQRAGDFKSNIKIIRGNQIVDAKSILSLMSLALGYEEEIIIRAEGPDEKEAITTLVELIESFTQ